METLTEEQTEQQTDTPTPELADKPIFVPLGDMLRMKTDIFCAWLTCHSGSEEEGIAFAIRVAHKIARQTLNDSIPVAAEPRDVEVRRAA